MMTKEERDELVLKHLFLVKTAVGTLNVAWAYGGVIDREDLESVATVALIESSVRWDPTNEKGASFRTFAWHRLIGACLDEIRKFDRISRYQRYQSKIDGVEIVNPRHVDLDALRDVSIDGRHGYDCPCCVIGFFETYREALKILRPKYRRVIRLRCEKEMKFREIGKLMGITKARVCQMFGQAQRLLGKKLNVPASGRSDTRIH